MTVVGTTMVTGSGRDELLELVHNAVEQDTFDVLAAVSISRFGGDIRGIFQMGQELSQCGKGLCLVKEHMQNGTFICCLPPVGYDLKDGTLIENQDAEIVQEIFKRYNAGEGMTKILCRRQ